MFSLFGALDWPSGVPCDPLVDVTMQVQFQWQMRQIAAYWTFAAGSDVRAWCGVVSVNFL